MFLFDHRLRATLALVFALANVGGCDGPPEEEPVAVFFDPPLVVAGRTTTVYLRGTGTNFVAGDLRVAFEEPAIEVRQVRVDDAVQARVELRVADEAAEGVQVADVQSEGRTFAPSIEVRAQAPTPSLAFNPSVAEAGARGYEVRAVGTETCFDAGDEISSTLRFYPEDGRITVESFEVASATEAVARLTLADDAAPGELSGVIESACGPVSAPFTIVSRLGPSIRLEPAEAFPGERVDVRVIGDGTSFETDRTSIQVLNAGVTVGGIVVEGPETLVTTLSIDALAATGATSFIVRTGEEETSAAFIVRRPEGAPAIRIAPNVVHRGERAFLWLEGVHTAFEEDADAALVAPPRGLVVHGTWTAGPTGAVVEVEAALDASVGTATLEIPSGDRRVRGSFSVARSVVTAAAVPDALAVGARAQRVSLTGSGTAFVQDVTTVETPASSGVSVRSVEVVSATELRVSLDVSGTAPIGPLDLRVAGAPGALRSRVRVDTPESLAGDEPATPALDPPAVRTGLGSTVIVDPAGGDGADGGAPEGTFARVHAPEITLGAPERGAEGVSIPMAVGAAARTEWTSLAYRVDGVERAASLQVVSLPAPSAETTTRTVVAGAPRETIIIHTSGASLLDGVTVATVASGQGLRLGASDVVGNNFIVAVSADSDVVPGPTGIVLTTHGEIAACAIDIVAPDDPPTAILTTEPLTPMTAARVEVRGTATSFEAGVTTAWLPEGLGMRIVEGGVHVQDTRSVAVDIEVDAKPWIGTVPLTLQTDLSIVRVPVSIVAAPGDPTLALAPLVVRKGRAVTLRGVTTGVDLTAEASVEIEGVEAVAVSNVRVVSSSEVEVTLDVGRDADEGMVPIVIRVGESSARASIQVLPGVPRVEAEPAPRVTRGQGAVEVSWDVPFGGLVPGDTFARIGPTDVGLVVRSVSPTSPEQVRLMLEALSPGPDRLAEVLLVTGSTVVVAPVEVRAGSVARLPRAGTAAGDVLPGNPALFLVDASQGWLDMDILSGFDLAFIDVVSQMQGARLDGPAAGLAIPLVADDPLLVRISAYDEGGAFSLAARDLAEDAAVELEPNDDVVSAEAFGDPADRPTILHGALAGADVDYWRLEASLPAVLEVVSGAASPSWAGPRVSLTAVDGAGGAIGPPLVSDNPVVAVAPGSALYAVEGVLGSSGAYLANLRSAVMISEVAPGDEPFVELRGVPGAPLDARWEIEVLDSDGEEAGRASLAGVTVGVDRLFVIASVAGEEVDLVDGAVLPLSAGARTVRVLYDGLVVDALHFGAGGEDLGEGAAAPDPSEGGSIGRTFGLDRNDNAVDFVVSPTRTAGSENN